MRGATMTGRVWLAVAAAATWIGPVVAEKPTPADAKPAETKPAEKPAPADAKPAETVAAERGPFEVVLELKGAFEPVAAAVIDRSAESFTQPLEILKVVPHGGRVAAGDVILQLDPDRIDRAIADLEVELASGAKALDLTRRELATAEAMAPLELAAAERRARAAKEDRARFTAVGRGLAEEESRFMAKAAQQNLRSTREELSQLEKMYRDKDLTEETEEMILQRTRFAVEAAEQWLRTAKVFAEDAVALELPRRASALEHEEQESAIALEKQRVAAPLQLEQKRLGLAKAEHDHRQSLRKLEELKHDRGLVEVRAPRAGLVAYGMLVDGAWTTAAVAGRAVVGKGVVPGELAFTVLEEGPVRFRARVEEQDLHLIGAGLAGRVAPTGYPDAAAVATLEPGFSPLPKDGKVTAAFAVVAPAGGPAILGGMTGTARFVVRSRPDATTVPEAAVFRVGDGQRVVYLPRENAAPERRVVKAGLTSGGRTEILEGLAAGDRVRTTKP